MASHEHILLPFSTPQPHALPSADSKATQAANNKEKLVVRHDTVLFRTIFSRSTVSSFLIIIFIINYISTRQGHRTERALNSH